MMREHRSSGSMVLVVIVFLSASLLLVSSLWQATVYVTEQSHLTYDYYCNLNNVETTLLYGVAVMIHNCQHVKHMMIDAQDHTVVFPVAGSAQLLGDNVEQAAIMLSKVNDDEYAVVATVESRMHHRYQASCRLIVTEQGDVVNFAITAWNLS